MRQNTDDLSVFIYHFRSTKTKRWYIVRVEQYPCDFFGIKFYLKSDSRSPRKYNRLSGLNEPRSVIYTCIAILMELAEQYLTSSFGFIGANLIGESDNETKRFRIYRRILTTFFSEEQYLHYQIVEKSAYALVRRKALESNPSLIDEINTYFSDNYTVFD